MIFGAATVVETPAIIETTPVVIQQAPTVAQQQGTQEPALALGQAEVVQKTVRVTVMLPQDARLWVDQVECPLAPTAVRTFTTQPLPTNQQFTYRIKMEVVRDGRRVSEMQQVLLTPGKDIQVDFNQRSAVRTVVR